MTSKDLEKVLTKVVENYFNGMSAKDAISKSLEIYDIENDLSIENGGMKI
ncbi:hypothetical protein [Clostridium sp.]|jgi:hypothetical protein|nr:hypothetical protein [Clostridium sp.]MDU2157481.1 hypothetical protein [Clostridium sp.]